MGLPRSGVLVFGLVCVFQLSHSSSGEESILWLSHGALSVCDGSCCHGWVGYDSSYFVRYGGIVFVWLCEYGDPVFFLL